jgi:hypothetical protein
MSSLDRATELDAKFMKELIDTMSNLAPANKVYFAEDAEVIVCECDGEVVLTIAEGDGHVYVFTVESSVWVLHFHLTLIVEVVVQPVFRQQLYNCGLEDEQLWMPRAAA